MVGFIHGHPDRPYVMGGLFHGKIGGGGSGNNTKSLSSKSGHSIELNDAGGITIKDKDKNSVFLSGDGSILSGSSIANITTVGASKNEPDGVANIKLDNCGNISLESNTKISLKTGDSSITLNSDGTIIIDGKIVCIDADNIRLDATKDIDLSSPSNHIGGGQTKIDGGDVFIN